MPRVLLLIPSASYRAPDFMDAAYRLGVEVVVGSDRPSPAAALLPGRSLALDMSDVEGATRAVAEFARAHSLEAVVAIDDGGTLVAARASEALGLPHNPVRAVEATRDKSLLREHLAEAGVPSPDFRVLEPADDLDEAARAITYPAVVKPLSLSGSRGVIRVDDPASFFAAVVRVRAMLSDPAVVAECGDDGGRLLVEGYIPGAEVSVEGLLADGVLHVLAVFDKPDPLEGPYFEETIYVTPSRLPAATRALVEATTERAAHALGLRDGPIHAELRVNEDGAWPVDIAARSIGGLCSRVLTFGAGMSLEELIVRHAVGMPAPTLEAGAQAAGVMMIPIPEAGTLVAVHGLAAAEATPGIEAIEISIRPGETLVPLPEGDRYLGFIFARADSPAAVEQALRAAHRNLRFEVAATAMHVPATAVADRVRALS